MIDWLVFVIELSLGALLIVLAYRMASLVRQEPFIPGSAVGIADEAVLVPSPRLPQNAHEAGRNRPAPLATIDRTELFTQLHILIGLQARDCRENGLDWQTAHHEVGHYAVAWLYGAACALCDKSLRHTGSLQGLVAQIASRKIPIRQSEAVQTLTTLTSNGTWLACYRHGLEGAEYWREHRFVPVPASLYDAVTHNAFI